MQDIYSNKWTSIQAAADNKKAVIKVEGIIGIPQAWLSDSRRQEDVKSTKQEMQNEIKKLKNLKVEQIELHINSYGGDVNHGIAMYEALLESGAEITCKIYGHTASIATVIAMAAPLERRTASVNAMGLVHEGRGWARGTVANIMAYAKWLTKINDQIADIYEKATGLTKDAAVELMSRVNGEGEWLTATELEEKKIISGTFEPQSAVACYADEINNCGWLPSLPSASVDTPPVNVEEVVEKASNSVLNKLKAYLPGFKDNSKSNDNSKKANMDATKFAALFAVLNLTAMESTDEGVHITMEQAEAINTALAAATKDKADLVTAQAAQTATLSALDNIDPTVAQAEGHEAKVAAVVAKLAAKPGAGPTNHSGGDGGTPSADGADWDAINALPHNQAADEDII